MLRVGAWNFDDCSIATASPFLILDWILFWREFCWR